MKKFISIFLILLGIIFISLPTIQDMTIEKKTVSVNREVKDISHDEILENIQSDAEFEFEAIEDVSPSNVIFGTINFDRKNIIGQLSIPDLDLDLPLLKGVTNSNLAVGVTTMRSNQVMGQGNYPIAGHNMKNKALLFGSLMDIEVGSLVYMTDKDTVYEYEIYENVVVEDTAMYMLEDKQAEKAGHPIISLMTCYHSSKSGKRFFALAKLIDQYPYEEDMNK